jgi:DNA ligase-1
MLFNELATYFEKLEATTGRTEMYRLLGELFGRAEPEETAEIAYLCEARLLPAFKGVETGMGDRMVAAAIAAAAGKPVDEVDEAYAEAGDLGLVAERLARKSRRPRLAVLEVYETLLELARTSGKGSSEAKVRMLAALLGRAAPREARYIVRFTLGRLRLGVGPPTIIEAVARLQEDPKEARAVVERAFNLCSDLGLVLETLRERGLDALARFKVRVGSPVRMMMAERLPSAEAIVARLGRCAAESKLDGFRCQVHLKSGKVEVFSRNLERMTDMFPDVAAAVREQIDARSAILDGEALAVNEATGEFYPFQVTVQRKRKHRVEEMAAEFPLVLVLFDLLYADGKDLTGLTYEARRAALERRIRGNGRIRPVERVITDEAAELQAFFDEGASRGLEGIIAKRLDSTYQAGARNFNWIKLKRAYRGELSDTVDVVVVGYLRGRGARARLGIGALLGAVYDEAADTFQTVGKIGSGLSDENWIRMREHLDKLRVGDKPARVDAQMKPDVWVEPETVVTVLADELTRSPIHTAARDEGNRGLALRFPRVVGFIRDDKSAEDATTAKEIRELYAMQGKKKK